MDDDHIRIRSYRRVLRVERKIHRVDKWVLPRAIPVEGVAWFAIAEVVLVVATAIIPPLDALLSQFGFIIRYVIVPALIAVLATQMRPDGRAAYRYIGSLIRWRGTSHRRSAGRPATRVGARRTFLARLRLRADNSLPELQHARIDGPARVEFRGQVDLRRKRRGGLVATPRGRRTRRRGQPALVTDHIQVPAGDYLEVLP